MHEIERVAEESTSGSEDGQRAHRWRVVSLCPKQLPWKLVAQFSLSRERDVANIIA